MHVCLICTELYGWGHSGGFGFATRSLGRELAARGVRVTVVVAQPRGTSQPRLDMDGFQAVAYPRRKFMSTASLYRNLDADLYISVEPSIQAHLAMQSAPDRRHVMYCRDPRTAGDWWTEARSANRSPFRTLLAAGFYDNPWSRRAIRRADLIMCPARFLIDKVRRKYGLRNDPVFMPTPVRIPHHVEKAPVPTVCHVGRLDPRKRPERFLALAPAFPDVRFVVVGASGNPAYQAQLEQTYGGHANITFLGFVDQFASDGLSRHLAASWVLVNTASREGLPVSFVEACAHRCAILSAVDPDGFASRFGHHVVDDDFARGLRHLLADERWQDGGERGYAYVAEHYESDRAVELHLATYRQLVEDAGIRPAGEAA